MSDIGYKKLTVWQKSVELVVSIYTLTRQFPREEMYGLTSQMRRAAVSIPSNIAEGSRRRGFKDTRHFLTIAFGSGAELETQIEIAKQLSYGNSKDFIDVDGLLEEVMKMLNVMINK